jgi:hypothetical protein
MFPASNAVTSWGDLVWGGVEWETAAIDHVTLR